MEESQHARARAEAKRRRILERAENRLDKIRGVAVADVGGRGDDVVSPDDVTLTAPAPAPRPAPPHSPATAGPARPDTTSRRHPLQHTDPDRKTVSSIDAESQHKLLHKYSNVNSVSLGITLRVLFALSVLSPHLQNAVVPFLLAEIALIYTFRTGLLYTSSAGHLLSTVLLMSGLSGEQLHLLKLAINGCQTALDHFTLFAASFITAHLLLSILGLDTNVS